MRIAPVPGVLVLLTLASAAGAATIEVGMSDRAFTPDVIAIQVGDTVLWRNTSGRPHTVTSGSDGVWDGLFDSLNMEPDAEFSYTFNETGSFPYYCDYHLPEMQARVEVMPATDAIELKLVKSNLTDIALSWSGGGAPYDVRRGMLRDGSDLMSIELVSSGTTTTDPGAVGDGASFYSYVVEGEPPPAPPTLTDVQNAVFTPVCTACHSGSSPSAGLNLEAGLSWAATVGVASGQQPALNRIEPGDPDQSYLVRKVEGDPSIDGQQMPRGGPPLSADLIQMIRAWILDGAPNN
jgi:plastocyanin